VPTRSNGFLTKLTKRAKLTKQENCLFVNFAHFVRFVWIGTEPPARTVPASPGRLRQVHVQQRVVGAPVQIGWRELDLHPILVAVPRVQAFGQSDEVAGVQCSEAGDGGDDAVAIARYLDKLRTAANPVGRVAIHALSHRMHGMLRAWTEPAKRKPERLAGGWRIARRHTHTATLPSAGQGRCTAAKPSDRHAASP